MALSSVVYPGDNIIPQAPMIYDRTRRVRASAASIFPWVIQLGAQRGGWYLTSFWERFLPKSWIPSQSIEPQWQNLAVGDRVPDYGAKPDEWFEVMEIKAPTTLVYQSRRYGTVFTWAILLEPVASDESVETVVHLRFRGQLQSSGLKRKALIWGGNLLDHWTTAPMLAGLAERAERQKVE